MIKLAEYRTKLQDYLHSKMGLVAPNLQSLIGDAVAARLISHAGNPHPHPHPIPTLTPTLTHTLTLIHTLALNPTSRPLTLTPTPTLTLTLTLTLTGSLTNLAKYPASTVQILGAEKR